MRRAINVIIVLGLLLSLMACNNTASDDSTSEYLRSEREIYIEWLLSGGYDELVFSFDKENIEISTCLIDIDDDGIYELLISLVNTKHLGPRGYHTDTALLGIKDGEVEVLAAAVSGGGTMGGSFLRIKYDILTERHVIIIQSHYRDGAFYFVNLLRTYSETFDFDLELEQHSMIIDSHYAEDVKTIKAETTLYYIEESRLVFHKINSEYVSSEAFHSEFERFIEPEDENFRLKVVTYDNPIPER